jgi:hypothetical protein
MTNKCVNTPVPLSSLAIIVFFLDLFTLGNRQVVDNQITNQIAFAIAVLSVLLFLIGVVKTLHDLLSKNKAAKKIIREEEEQGLKYMSEENIKKTKEKKKWQPVNIILGLLMIGFIVYFCWPKSSLVACLRLIPAIVLILTRRNNLFSFIILLLFGLTIFGLPTFDGFFILGSAVYMLISAVLRMFKVKRYVVIGLAAALILGFGFSWEYANTFIHENSLTIQKEINNEDSIKLVSETGKTSTIFNHNQGISPSGEGLQKGTYAYRVINKSGDVVVPLDKWPTFKIKANGDVVQRGTIINWVDVKDVALHGEFNTVGWLPVSIGDYTIQLVKIEGPKGTIIAESNFSIVPYDKQTISTLTVYLTAGDDLSKHYDSYTHKEESISVTAWAQSPKGEVISGTVRYPMTNSKGDIEKTSWMGVNETAFRTNPDGTPVSLGNISGNPQPGLYHFQIIIDGNVVSDLKYHCGV